MKNKYIIGGVIIIVLAVIVFVTNKKSEIKDDGVLTVGVALPMTGTTAQFGEYSKRGIEASVDGNPNIKLIYEDNKGDAASSVSAFHKLVGVDNVDVVVSVLSKTSVPLVPLAKQNKVPMIVTFTSANNATNKDNEYVYRIFWTADLTGKLFADRIIEQNIKSVGILQAKNESAQSNADVIVSVLKKAGVKVTIETFQDSDTDFRTQITKVKNEKPEVIGVITVPSSQMKGIVTQLKELKVNLPIYDVLGIFLNPGTPEALGELGNGIYTLTTSFNAGEYKQNYRDDYINKYNREPAGFETFAIDTGTMLKQLVVNNATSRESVLSYLKSLKSFEGVTGPYTVDESHNFLVAPVKAQFVNGKIVKSEK